MDQPDIIAISWEGLRSLRGKNEMVARSTNRLTQEQCQEKRRTLCCSGGGVSYLATAFFIRSGEEWKICGSLKASVGVEPNKPPTNGWKFYNGKDFETDPMLTCSPIVNSPPCCLTVSLSGGAKKAQGKCEGEYRSMELTSMGLPVKIFGCLISNLST